MDDNLARAIQDSASVFFTRLVRFVAGEAAPPARAMVPVTWRACSTPASEFFFCARGRATSAEA